MHLFVYIVTGFKFKTNQGDNNENDEVENTIFMKIHYSSDVVKRYKTCTQSSFVNGKETIVGI